MLPSSSVNHILRTGAVYIAKGTLDTVGMGNSVKVPVVVARIVHEADLADERYDAPEAPGLDVVLRGLSMVADDHRVLELTGPLFDGLYEYLKGAAILGRTPSD